MKAQMNPKTYYTFIKPKSEKYLLTITAPNEYIFQIEQQWPGTIRDTIQLDSGAVVEFEKHSSTVLPKDGSPCSTQENITHFIDCFRAELWEKFEKYECVSHMFYDLLQSQHHSKSKLCGDGNEKEMDQQYKIYASMALNFSKRNFSGSQCMMPCTMDFYNPYFSRSKQLNKRNIQFILVKEKNPSHLKMIFCSGSELQ